MKRGRVLRGGILLLAVVFSVFFIGSEAVAQVKVGETEWLGKPIHTPHPYSNGSALQPVVWSHTIHHPGAFFIKIHFDRFEVEGVMGPDVTDKDYVLIKDKDGNIVDRLTGSDGQYPWALSVKGDKAIIELYADERNNDYGFVIDRYVYGTEPSVIVSICGDDNKVGICETADDSRIRLSDPVAKISFVSDCGGSYVCTGFLFSDNGCFMTNAHCVNTVTEVQSAEFLFNFIDDGTPNGPCSLPDRPNPDPFRGGTFIRMDYDLDVSLVIIDDPVKGNPADIYGHLLLDGREPSEDEDLWIPQHPQGRLKEIAEPPHGRVSSDLIFGHTAIFVDPPFCDNLVPSIFLTDFGYKYDTEGGSSGSPVLDMNNLVVGIHHRSGCKADGSGENAGILMDRILPLIDCGICLPMGFAEAPIENEFDPPDPWVQDGLLVDTVSLISTEDIYNLRFFSDPLQCTDVLCEPGDVKRIHESLIELVPEQIAFVPARETLEIEVKQTIPIGQHAGSYSGEVHGVGETRNSSCATVSADLSLTITVNPSVDMDVDDNHGNVSENVMTLKGAKETTVSGVFTVVNPNSEVKNVDLSDGPGNIRVEPVSVSATDLVKIGDPTEHIPSGRIAFASLNSLGSGEAQDVQVDVSIPGGLPVNAVYEGTVTVTYDECVYAGRPNRNILGAGPVSDEFILRVEVLPTQGDLSLELVGREHFCPNPFPNPWVQSGQAPLSFDVTAYGDHRNIRISSGGLKHDSLDKKLDDFNFFPEEIAFLPAGETRSVIAIVVVPIGQHEGTYEGTFQAVSENGGESEALVDVDVCDLADMDIDDNHGNVSDNVMTLRGAKNDTVFGKFTIVSPNCLTTNVDFADGPGNVGVGPVSISSTDLKKVGGVEVIPSGNITLDALAHLGSGDSKDLGVTVVIPGDIPVNAIYMGIVTAVYQGDLPPFEEVRDSFELKVEVYPTQGPLDIVETSLMEEFCPPDPWTQVGQIEFGFEINAHGDHRNIRVSSGGLRHDSLDKKLDDFNFFPEEIAFLAAGETREVMVITKVPIGQHEGSYSGVFRVVSENGGEDSVFAAAEVCVHPDLDIEDNLANLSENVMHLEGPRSGVAYGTFSLVNPNCTESNIDRYDGPGNLALEHLIAIPSDLWFAAGGPPPKEPIPASLIDIDIYPDPSHLPSGAGAYGVVQVQIPKKSEHWVPGYNFEYWGDVEVRGYVPADSVSDGFKIELRVLKAIGGSLLSSFWGEQMGDGNLIHWSKLGILESGYSLYRNGLKVADVGEDVFEYSDLVSARAAHEYRLGVQVGGSEIMIGPITVGGGPVHNVYLLHQNHPNPFRCTTTIRYQMAAAGHVTLKVFNVSGGLVRTLEDAEKDAGYYTVEWDGKDNSNREAGNGVYFYQIVCGDFCKNLKMTLLR